MDGLIAYALAKKYTDKVGQDIISAGFKVQVEDNRSILNRQGEEKVLYLLPKEYGSSQDGYDEFVYANNTWEWVGKTDVDLSNYATQEWVSQNFKNIYINIAPPAFPSDNYAVGDLFLYNQKMYQYVGTRNLIGVGTYIRYKKTGRKIVLSELSKIPPETSTSNSVSDYDVGDIFAYSHSSAANSQGAMTSDVYICTDVLFHSSYGNMIYNYAWKKLPFNATTLEEYGITDAQLKIDDNNKLSSDLVDDANNTNKFVTSQEKNTWNNKANQATTLAGYGIIDAYTKTEVDAKLSALVSGVVNANGTITFTDSEGNSFTTSGSNLVTSSNEQISMGYDDGGFYFLFDDGQEESK